MADDFLGITGFINYILGQQESEEQKEATDRAYRNAGGKIPQFDTEGYKPTNYQLPEDVQHQGVSIDPALRAKQLAAIQQMQDLSEGRVQSQSALDRYLAMQQAQQAQKGQTEAALANAQARGVGGSGMEFAMRGQAGQNAANLAQSGGMQSAAQAALERMQAGQQYQGALQNLRGQDTDLSQRNADIINRFNQLNSQNRLQALQANVNMQNQAQAGNVNRNDTNKKFNYGAQYQNSALAQQLLPYQKGDISGDYSNQHQLVDSWGNKINSMGQAIGGGGSGANFGGQGGGAQSGGGGLMNMFGGQQQAPQQFPANNYNAYGNPQQNLGWTNQYSGYNYL